MVTSKLENWSSPQEKYSPLRDIRFLSKNFPHVFNNIMEVILKCVNYFIPPR